MGSDRTPIRVLPWAALDRFVEWRSSFVDRKPRRQRNKTVITCGNLIEGLESAEPFFGETAMVGMYCTVIELPVPVPVVIATFSDVIQGSTMQGPNQCELDCRYTGKHCMLAILSFPNTGYNSTRDVH